MKILKYAVIAMAGYVGVLATAQAYGEYLERKELERPQVASLRDKVNCDLGDKVACLEVIKEAK